MACIYYLRLPGKEELVFKSKKALVEYIRVNNLTDELKAGTREYDMTTSDLVAVLRQVKFGESNFKPKVLEEFQSALLDEFIRIEEQSTYFSKLSSAIALTKGLGKSFDSIDKLKKNLNELGIDTELDSKIPFDVRYLLTGRNEYKSTNNKEYFHKLTANNIRIAKEIDALSKTMFMERTSTFIHTLTKVLSNLKDGLISDKVKEVQDELSAFAQVAAYKQWISVTDKKTSTLRNSLIYDNNSNIPTIVDIVREAIDIAPENTFLQFVLPVSTVIKVGKRKQMNKAIARDLINTIEGKTRGKIEPDLIASMMDSFTELYQNPRTQFHAKALFDYLIVKDGLMFKNKSFIKLLPTIMFKEMSEATDIATRVMAANTEGEFKTILKDLNGLELFDKEGNPIEYFSEKERIELRDQLKSKDVMKVRNTMFKKVFNLSYNELYDRFENIYATDIRNQYNLELMRLRYRPKNGGATRAIDSIKTITENGVKYVHIDLFNDKFKSMEKGEERSNYFGEIINQLEQGGFPAKSDRNKEGVNIAKIYFKKFMRLRESIGEDSFHYVTYKLVSVKIERPDGDPLKSEKNKYTTYSGAAMTEQDEYTPTGTYAVYAPIEPVGASNTTGVADLGVRPTKVEILKTIANKIKGDDNAAGATSVIPKDTPTPGLGGGVLGLEDAGTSFTVPNTESIQGAEGIINPTVKDHAMSYKMPAKENIWNRETSTLTEVEAGNRTASTRSYALGKVGDVITFEGRPQLYRITAVERLTKEKVESREWVENWSAKEGWTIEHFKKVLGGSTVHIGSWQTTFEKIESAKQETPKPTAGLGDIFGQLGQAPYDPSTDSPFMDFDDEDVNEQPC